MHFTTSDHLSLYFETHGDPQAAPVILVHGIGADHGMWRPQIISLLNAGCYIIVPDARVGG